MVATSNTQTQENASSKVLHTIMGPVLFLVALAIPALGPMNARVGFGILFWMVYWWITVAVDIKVTCLVPLFVVAIYNYMPVDKVMQAYVHKEFFLIAGATAVTTAWARWGFAKRMGLKFLLRFGNSTRLQMVGWFWLTGVVSFVMGNTPVAAVFAPIAVSALIYAGYDSFEKRWKSNAASNILIAVAWGASVGGMTTPIGGGQAVVTLAMLEKYLGHKVFFIDWTLRMLPVSLCVMIAMALFMYFFMKPEVEFFTGSREFYKKELKDMGPLTFEEKVVAWGFALIVLMVMAQPLYAGLLKSPYFKWLDPSPLFFLFAIALFFLPSRSAKGENLLSIPSLTKHFPVAVIFIWPGAVALGRILDQTGASAIFGQWLRPFIEAGDLSGLVAFSIGPNALSQVTSDTAAAGVMIPLVIEAFKGWHGLPFGAVPFIWVAGSALSWSYAVASSTGAQGICAGFGANLKRMFLYGMIGAAISVVVTILYFGFFIVYLGSDFYILPPSM
jgi:sodium-dependent dicarboxylate transporter 2/3/5